MKYALKMLPILALALLLAQAPAQAAAPAAGQKPNIEKQDFDNWRLECMSAPSGGKKVCQLFQRIVAENKEKKSKFLVVSAKIGIVPEKAKDGTVKEVTRMLLLTPLGTLLPTHMTVKLDNEKAATTPFIVCTPEGCMADIALGDKLLDKLKNGKALQVSYKHMSGKPITASVSLKGFATGLKALNEKRSK